LGPLPQGILGNLSQAQQGQAGQGGHFEWLRQLPQFNQIRAMIQQNPQHLATLFQLFHNQNPELLRIIDQHQAEFIALLNEPITGGPAPGQNYIQVTREEKEAIDRLEGLGFNRSIVIQAYFACDKDETLAANYLFEHANEFEQDDNADAQ